MSKKLTKVLVIMLAIVMVVSLGACGQSTDTPDTDTKKTDTAASTSDTSIKDVTLTIYMDASNACTPGIQENAIAKAIKERTGISLNVINADADKFKVMLAGKDLPDVFYSNMTSQGMVSPNTLIKNGNVMDITELVEKNAPNLMSLASKIDYSKKFLSNETGKLYYIPVYYSRVKDTTSQVPGRNGGEQFYARWDLYKKLGCPEITTNDDFLNVMKQIQDLNPTNAEGKKTYALSGWSDWGLWPFFIPTTYGQGLFYTPSNVYFNRNDNSYNYVYLTDEFWHGLYFFSKAYNMGILDPEAFTQKYTDYDNKIKSGQVLSANAGWWIEGYNKLFSQTEGEKDWALMPLKSGYPCVTDLYIQDKPVGDGADHAECVSSTCSNPEAAIKLLDFFNSEEGAILGQRGIEGEDWEKDASGKIKWTQKMLDGEAASPTYKNDRGIGLLGCYFNSLNGTYICSDGSFVNFQLNPENIKDTLTPAEKDSCDYYGVNYPGEILNKWVSEGSMKGFSDIFLWTKLVQSESDATLKITAQCEQYMRVQAVKAIMAASEQDFNKIKEESIAGMKSKGIDDAMKEYTTLFDAAKEAASSFKY